MSNHEELTEVGAPHVLDVSLELQYLERLYAEMGKISNQVIPDRAVTGIFRRLKPWQWEPVHELGHNARVLERDLASYPGKVALQGVDSERRKLSLLDGLLRITVPSVIGDDIRRIAGIEYKILSGQVLEKEEFDQFYLRNADFYDQAIEIFQEDHEHCVEGVNLSGAELAILKMFSLHSKQAEIAKMLGTSTTDISRTLSGLRQKIGFKALGHRTITDTALFGISLGVVDTRLYANQSSRQDIPESRQKFLKEWFSPENISMRFRGIRPTIPTGTVGSTWNRLKQDIGADTRVQAVIVGVRLGIIEVPTPDFYRNLKDS